MEIFLRWCIALAVQPILCFALIFSIKAAIYIGEEINHNIKNFKRHVRETMWELEWKLKLLKGR